MATGVDDVSTEGGDLKTSASKTFEELERARVKLERLKRSLRRERFIAFASDLGILSLAVFSACVTWGTESGYGVLIGFVLARVTTPTTTERTIFHD